MAKLILSLDGSVLNEILLAKERTTIGRKPHNDIQIDNLAVSGEHAAIVSVANDCILEDLGSTNGTLVNGAPVKKHILRDNDVIELGKFKLKFVGTGAAKTAADYDKTMVWSRRCIETCRRGCGTGRAAHGRSGFTPSRSAPCGPGTRCAPGAVGPPRRQGCRALSVPILDDRPGAAGDRCRRLPGVSGRLTAKLNRHEEFLRAQIVLSGLVNDPKLPVLGGLRVGHGDIQLSPLQRHRAPHIVDADNQPSRCSRHMTKGRRAMADAVLAGQVQRHTSRDAWRSTWSVAPD